MCPSDSLYDRIIQGVLEVQQRMERTVAALGAAKVPFAVVGDQATAIWIASVDAAATRTARGTEILVNSADGERVAIALRQLGLESTDLMPHRFFPSAEPRSSNVVRIVWPQSLPEGRKPRVHPSIEDAVVLQGVPVLPLEQHITMLLSKFRMDDQVDLIDLIGVNLVDRALVNWLDDSARKRLEQSFEQQLRERRDFKD